MDENYIALPIELIANILINLHHNDILKMRIVNYFMRDIIDCYDIYKSFYWFPQNKLLSTMCNVFSDSYPQYFMRYRKRITYVFDIKNIFQNIYDESLPIEFKDIDIFHANNIIFTPMKVFNFMAPSERIRNALNSKDTIKLIKKIIIGLNLYINCETSNEYTIDKVWNLIYALLMSRASGGLIRSEISVEEINKFEKYYNYDSPYVKMYEPL
jgi:hypothetical protein